MMSPNLFYQDFLLCIGVASLIFGLFLLFFKAPANNIYQPYRRSKSLLAAGYLVMSLNIMFWASLSMIGIPSPMCWIFTTKSSPFICSTLYSTMRSAIFWTITILPVAGC